MARITKSARDAILSATNEFLVSISVTEEVELVFSRKDDAISDEINLVCKKNSKSGGLKRFIEYKDGTIKIKAGASSK